MRCIIYTHYTMKLNYNYIQTLFNEIQHKIVIINNITTPSSYNLVIT